MSAPPPFKHILVALDASPHSLAALATAAELAAELGAELAGLFVEDTDLLHSASLPFVRQVSIFSSAATDAQQMECQFRVQADQMRRDLALAAERLQVPWTFQVARGRVDSEVAAAADATDLLILGRTGWRAQQSGALGSTARRLLARAPRPTLMLQRRQLRLATPLAVLCDGTAASQEALATAAALTRVKGGPLEVLLVGTDLAPKTELAEWVRARLGPETPDLRYRVSELNFRGIAPLAHALNRTGAGALVLPCGLLEMAPDTLQTLIGQIEAPVLLVGPTDRN